MQVLAVGDECEATVSIPLRRRVDASSECIMTVEPGSRLRIVQPVQHHSGASCACVEVLDAQGLQYQGYIDFVTSSGTAQCRRVEAGGDTKSLPGRAPPAVRTPATTQASVSKTVLGESSPAQVGEVRELAQEVVVRATQDPTSCVMARLCCGTKVEILDVGAPTPRTDLASGQSVRVISIPDGLEGWVCLPAACGQIVSAPDSEQDKGSLNSGATGTTLYVSGSSTVGSEHLAASDRPSFLSAPANMQESPDSHLNEAMHHGKVQDLRQAILDVCRSCSHSSTSSSSIGCTEQLVSSMPTLQEALELLIQLQQKLAASAKLARSLAQFNGEESGNKLAEDPQERVELLAAFAALSAFKMKQIEAFKKKALLETIRQETRTAAVQALQNGSLVDMIQSPSTRSLEADKAAIRRGLMQASHMDLEVALQSLMKAGASLPEAVDGMAKAEVKEAEAKTTSPGRTSARRSDRINFDAFTFSGEETAGLEQQEAAAEAEELMMSPELSQLRERIRLSVQEADCVEETLRRSSRFYQARSTEEGDIEALRKSLVGTGAEAGLKEAGASGASAASEASEASEAGEEEEEDDDERVAGTAASRCGSDILPTERPEEGSEAGKTKKEDHKAGQEGQRKSLRFGVEKGNGERSLGQESSEAEEAPDEGSRSAAVKERGHRRAITRGFTSIRKAMEQATNCENRISVHRASAGFEKWRSKVKSCLYTAMAEPAKLETVLHRAKAEEMYPPLDCTSEEEKIDVNGSEGHRRGLEEALVRALEFALDQGCSDQDLLFEVAVAINSAHPNHPVLQRCDNELPAAFFEYQPKQKVQAIPQFQITRAASSSPLMAPLRSGSDSITEDESIMKEEALEQVKNLQETLRPEALALKKAAKAGQASAEMVQALRRGEGHMMQGLRRCRALKLCDDPIYQAAVEFREKLAGLLQELQGPIRVFCRIRALKDSEVAEGETCAVTAVGLDTVSIHTAGNEERFVFDSVFLPGSQEEILRETNDLLQLVGEGGNVILLSYGASGARKSFLTASKSENGICLLEGIAMETFSVIESCGPDYDTETSISVLEVFDDVVVDLLGIKVPSGSGRKTVQGRKSGRTTAASPTPTVPQARVSLERDGVVGISGFSEELVTNTVEVMEGAMRGANARSVALKFFPGAPSHFVLILRTRMTNRETGDMKESAIILVHLAATDEVQKMASQARTAAPSTATADGMPDVRDLAADSVNCTFSALGDLFECVAKKKPPPVDESSPKLLLVVRHALGGNEPRGLLVASCAPGSATAEESLACLRFASRAKSGVLVASTNVVGCPSVATRPLRQKTKKLDVHRKRPARKSEKPAASPAPAPALAPTETARGSPRASTMPYSAGNGGSSFCLDNPLSSEPQSPSHSRLQSHHHNQHHLHQPHHSLSTATNSKAHLQESLSPVCIPAASSLLMAAAAGVASEMQDSAQGDATPKSGKGRRKQQPQQPRQPSRPNLPIMPTSSGGEPPSAPTTPSTPSSKSKPKFFQGLGSDVEGHGTVVAPSARSSSLRQKVGKKESLTRDHKIGKEPGRPSLTATPRSSAGASHAHHSASRITSVASTKRGSLRTGSLRTGSAPATTRRESGSVLCDCQGGGEPTPAVGKSSSSLKSRASVSSISEPGRRASHSVTPTSPGPRRTKALSCKAKAAIQDGTHGEVGRSMTPSTRATVVTSTASSVAPAPAAAATAPDSTTKSRKISRSASKRIGAATSPASASASTAPTAGRRFQTASSDATLSTPKAAGTPSTIARKSTRQETARK